MKHPPSFMCVPCLALALAAPGCGGASSTPAEAATAVKLQGAGASFPAPLYNKWFKAYSAAHQNVLVDYQSVGSGSGVKSVIDRTVDFGASDAAMKPEDMAKVDGGVQLFPMTAGSIVLAYNVQGDRRPQAVAKRLPGIFLGKVTRWNDPAIARGQPRRQAARPAHQRRRARRQQRDVVRVLATPERDQRRVQQDRGRQHDAELAGRAPSRRATKVSPPAS